MSAHATYVYCVVHRDRPAAVRNMPSGVPGSSRPALLDVSPALSIVVSTVPLGVYGREPLERRLHDLDWVASVALAHEAVVERMGRISAATIIPMKLFTMFSEPERAVAEMRSRRGQLSNLVKRIRGCQEWGVRVTPSASRPQRPARKTAVRSGADFLAAKKRARDDARDQAERLHAEAESVLASLGRVARQAKRRLPPDSAATPPVLEAAFLVPQARNARFAAAARDAARRCRAAGGDLVLTGPWPAYNFVDDGEPGA
jgi:Gas vesicle synthesis protein GvpL/GvpF